MSFNKSLKHIEPILQKNDFNNWDKMNLEDKIEIVFKDALEAFDELGIVDGEHGRIIPFEYFEPENKDKLVELIKKI